MVASTAEKTSIASGVSYGSEGDFEEIIWACFIRCYR